MAPHTFILYTLHFILLWGTVERWRPIPCNGIKGLARTRSALLSSKWSHGVRRETRGREALAQRKGLCVASAGAGAAKERVGVLAIALHNLAVEQEHTMQIEEALRSYANASAVAEAYVGNDHAITATLRNAHELAYGRCLPPPRPKRL